MDITNFHMRPISMICEQFEVAQFKKVVKNRSKVYYFGPLEAHFGFYGTLKRSNSNIKGLKCKNVMSLNRFYQNCDPKCVKKASRTLELLIW